MLATTTNTALRVGGLLAWAAAAFYLLMAAGIPYPDLGVQRGLFAIAGVAYAVGGAILWRGVDRRLLMFGAVANVAVIVIWTLRAATGAAPADGFAIASKVIELALGAVLLTRLVGAFRVAATGSSLSRPRA